MEQVSPCGSTKENSCNIPHALFHLPECQVTGCWHGDSSVASVEKTPSVLVFPGAVQRRTGEGTHELIPDSLCALRWAVMPTQQPTEPPEIGMGGTAHLVEDGLNPCFQHLPSWHT